MTVNLFDFLSTGRGKKPSSFLRAVRDRTTVVKASILGKRVGEVESGP